MPVKVEIFIQASADSLGETLSPGPEKSRQIKSWLNSLSIDNIVTGTWLKFLDTGQTTTANLTLWPSTLSLMQSLSPSSSKNTSPPSPPTSDGTATSPVRYYRPAASLLLLVGGAGFLVGAMTTLLFAKPLPSTLKDQLAISSTEGCLTCGDSISVSYYSKFMMPYSFSIQRNKNIRYSLRSSDQ